MTHAFLRSIVSFSSGMREINNGNVHNRNNEMRRSNHEVETIN